MDQEAQEISVEDLAKVSLKFGTVLAAERVEKSEKLLRLDVGFGDGPSVQVLAGIGRAFQPEALVGRQFLFVTNLPPRKMMGLESRGMILAAGPPDDPALISAVGAGGVQSRVPDGSRAR